MSSVLAFGGYTFNDISQPETDKIMEIVLEHDINHIDVAPSYGMAEERLGNWIRKHRDNFFLACKTQKRTKNEARRELDSSLKRLKAEYFDLYQLHALDSLSELDTALGEGGAMEAILEAKEEGLVRHVGITSHVPLTIFEAVRRFDFDTILFPLNYILKCHAIPENDYGPLLKLAKKKDLGTIAMKAFTKQPWQGERRYQTWYEPWDTQDRIDEALWFTLSQGVTTAASSGEPRLFEMMVDAAERYRSLSRDEQRELIESAAGLKPLFPRR
jgi:aryl-alcohol dehydrogenase-like predicted oxidoreductase